MESDIHATLASVIPNQGFAEGSPSGPKPYPNCCDSLMHRRYHTLFLGDPRKPVAPITFCAPRFR